jgi:hypothetical protein
MTRADLLAERLDLVAKLHAAQAIIDAVLDRITVEPKRKAPPKKSGKKTRASK